MQQTTNLLLTGASGAIGYEVLQLLESDPHPFNITIFDLESRNNIRKLKPFQDRVKIVYGDIRDKEDVYSVCKDQDVVIHLAAIIPPLADEAPELARRVNVLGTKNLVTCLEELSPDAFLLYSSSVGIYGDRLENPYIMIDDPIPYSSLDAYSKTKVDAETIIKESDLNWSIFRLSAIMGKHRMSKLLFHMPLATSLEISTPAETANALVRAIWKKEELNRRIFNLGGGKSKRTTFEKYLERSFAIFGLGKLDFPDHAFASRNFHCGYYKDGDELEEILGFRTGTLEDHFQEIDRSTPLIQKWFTRLFRGMIKRRLLKESEPYKAFLSGDKKEMARFF